MKPTELVQLYFDHHNAGDVDSVMALYDDDAIFEMAGNFVRHGKSELREMESFDASVHDYLVPMEMKEINGEVHCQVKQTNDFLKASNIPSLSYAGCIFAIDDGEIERITAVMGTRSARALAQATTHVAS